MNKRQAKKNYKKALELMKTSRRKGIGVKITNYAFVDKNGKICDGTEKGNRFIKLKRPKIEYIRSTK